MNQPSSEELALRGQNWHEPREMTDEERQKVLAYITEHPEAPLSQVARETGVHRADIKLARRSDDDFVDDYRTARGYGETQIINATVEEAIIGKRVPIVSGGKVMRDDEGEIMYEHKRDPRLLGLVFQAITPEGKAMMARKLGIEISGPEGGPITVQRGISFDEVYKVLETVGKLPLLEEAPEGSAEIVSEEDV